MKFNSKELSFFFAKKSCDNILNPPRTINKSEKNKALCFINRETDESDEEFYEKAKKKTIAYHYKLLSSLYILNLNHYSFKTTYLIAYKLS